MKTTPAKQAADSQIIARANAVGEAILKAVFVVAAGLMAWMIFN